MGIHFESAAVLRPGNPAAMEEGRRQASLKIPIRRQPFREKPRSGCRRSQSACGSECSCMPANRLCAPCSSAPWRTWPGRARRLAAAMFLLHAHNPADLVLAFLPAVWADQHMFLYFLAFVVVFPFFHNAPLYARIPNRSPRRELFVLRTTRIPKWSNQITPTATICKNLHLS